MYSVRKHAILGARALYSRCCLPNLLCGYIDQTRCIFLLRQILSRLTRQLTGYPVIFVIERRCRVYVDLATTTMSTLTSRSDDHPRCTTPRTCWHQPHYISDSAPWRLTRHRRQTSIRRSHTAATSPERG